MRTLYLVRHASPVIQPGVPSREWTLSDRGVREARALAETAKEWGLRALYSSSEVKARATALIVGDALGLQVNVVDAFDELRIPEFIANADDFNEVVRAVLEERDIEPPRLDPQIDQRLESASAAAARFAEGVRIVEQGPFPAAIASHGRVLTAYLWASGRVSDPFAAWRAIPMPGWASVDLDGDGFLRPFDA